jgi:hypothetical protein
MRDSSRIHGALICVGTVVLAVVFLAGLLNGQYWAVAIPVAIVVFFALGLSFWIGYTIATIRVEPEVHEPPAGGADADAATDRSA